MIKKTVYLDPDQYIMIEDKAKAKGQSFSHALRSILDKQEVQIGETFILTVDEFHRISPTMVFKISDIKDRLAYEKERYPKEYVETKEMLETSSWRRRPKKLGTLKAANLPELTDRAFSETLVN